MDDYSEIAHAAVSNRLCFFTGTGFSKAVTDGEAPSWKELLEELCLPLEDADLIKESLFPENTDSPLSLEEAAHIIGIKLLQIDKRIHSETAEIIGKLELKGNNDEVSKFLSENTFTVVTTNYDKLIENISGLGDCQSLTPGLPVPRSEKRVKVYHIHGSVDSPENMILTAEDYFKFTSRESYFSRKLSTLIHENAVVILGYSLGDSNLKSIIRDYRVYSKDNYIWSNIFFVSRDHVNQNIKDYYSDCYGIRVLDDVSVEEFFRKVNLQTPRAKEEHAKGLDTIQKVVFENHFYKDKYLEAERSFFEILLSLNAVGLTINDPKLVKILGRVIDKKTELTGVQGAWPQYDHLARWLIHLAKILDLKNSPIEDVFLSSTLKSMTRMSREKRLGYSWHAFNLWSRQWSSIKASNRMLIKDFITENTTDPDALYVVRLAV